MIYYKEDNMIYKIEIEVSKKETSIITINTISTSIAARIKPSPAISTAVRLKTAATPYIIRTVFFCEN